MAALTELRELAAKDLCGALAEAERENAAWKKCQALAWVARYAPAGRVVGISRAALAAAREADDPYHSTFASAWPLRALLERDQAEAASDALAPILLQSQGVTPMASRSEALFLIFQAVVIGEAHAWASVFGLLMDASSPPRHWRQGRNIRDAVLIVASRDVGLAHRAMAQLDDAKLRRKLEGKLASGVCSQPRAFFW